MTSEVKARKNLPENLPRTDKPAKVYEELSRDNVSKGKAQQRLRDMNDYRKSLTVRLEVSKPPTSRRNTLTDGKLSEISASIAKVTNLNVYGQRLRSEPIPM